MEEHGKSEMLTWCCPAADTDVYAHGGSSDRNTFALG